MSYLNRYPTIVYNGKVLTDITRRVVIEDEIKRNAALTTPYTIRDGEWPEDVAYNFYGSTDYMDIILLMNDIIDPFYGWVLPSDILEDYINGKYGTNIHSTHHHEKDGIIVHPDTSGAKAISNHEYELRENENRRHIRILNPEYLEFVNIEMDAKINQKTQDKALWQN